MEPRFSNLIHSGKLENLIHSRSEKTESPSSPERHVTVCIAVSTKGFSGRELRPEVLLDNWDFFCEQLGWETNCSRTKMFENWGLTINLKRYRWNGQMSTYFYFEYPCSESCRYLLIWKYCYFKKPHFIKHSIHFWGWVLYSFQIK